MDKKHFDRLGAGCRVYGFSCAVRKVVASSGDRSFFCPEIKPMRTDRLRFFLFRFVFISGYLGLFALVVLKLRKV